MRLAAFPSHIDLRPAGDALRSAGIAHELIVEGEHTVLCIDERADPDVALELVKAALSPVYGGAATQAPRSPVVMILLALSILGAMLPQWHFDGLHWFTFQDFRMVSTTQVIFATLDDTLASGQYWRLITPIFIHFGIFHIAFNGLWLWEFGRRIEAFGGGLHLAMLVLISGLVSNFGQYYWSGPSLFGGMSGVLYALLGYLWIRNRIAPHPALALPPGIIGFMIAWLLICMTGIIDLFFQGSVANAAHASGLISGMVLGFVFGVLKLPARSAARH
ncbi:MAG: rhomboid family intramembrane serine protease [Pseudomonas sp.]